MHDIPILMLHSVNDKHNLNPMGSLSIYPRELEGYLSAYKRLNYQMISVKDFIDGKVNENEKFIILTFDDGFKDNLINAKNILMKYNARATIFINPAYCTKISDHKNTWGFMSYEELQEAEKSDVFDLQAHGMTHEFIFKTDKIVDFYSKDKFSKYYWLAWMLFPNAPNNWSDDVYKYAEKIPEGYPIFEYDRRLSSQKFTPDESYIDKILSLYKGSNNNDELLGRLNNDKSVKGTTESYEEYLKEIEYQLGECKDILEDKLSKEISVLCFPGGGYNRDVLKIAEEVGYRCYMNASMLKNGNNFNNFDDYKNGDFTGFNRISLSHFESRLLSSEIISTLIAMISLGDYQNIKTVVVIKNILKKIKSL